MIDPGRPFTRTFGDVTAALEDRLRNGVEQTGTLLLTFHIAGTNYPLPSAVESITNVSGLVNNQYKLFTQGTDYALEGNRLAWINPTMHPDDGSQMSVDYVYREPPSGLTDLNVGSVAGTLMRAFARELALLYEQMNEAYRRAFIDTASGVALDNVVALLHVARNQSVPATGVVTFSRKSPAQQTYPIPAGTKVADASARVFVTTVDASIPPASPLDELASAQAGSTGTPPAITVTTTRAIAELDGVWHSADAPDLGHKLSVSTGFGNDQMTITLDPSAGVKGGDPLRISYKPLSVDVQITAQNAGPDGNVLPKTITVMPTPPPGIDAVTNSQPTTGGQDPEPDDQLRDRAKHELERAGNASLDALKYAVLAVPGVSGVEVIDRSVDSSIALGEVRIRYAVAKNDSVDAMAVLAAIDKTRAAGIVAVPEQVTEVAISGTFVVIPAGANVPPDAAITFLQQAGDAVAALAIGAPLGVRKLSALAFGITGFADVAEAQLTFSRPVGTPTTGLVTDPFPVARTEIVVLDEANVQVKVLFALSVGAPQAGTGDVAFTLPVQLLDPTSTAVSFVDYPIDLDVTINAFSKASPDNPPVQISKPRKSVRFTATTNAQIDISKSNDLKNFDATQQSGLEFVVAASAYSGLTPATTSKVNWTG